LAGVRKVLFGGEKVSVPHVRQALKVMGASKLIHVYGPTESTVFATAYPVAAVEEGAATVPIGKPISNTEAYVLDSSLRIQPQGVPGELCLSGAGLAKGYLNQPELTAERFVDHPYAPGEKLYRTGDLVRLLEDGNIEYIGRMDQQVKIRGFRIEPGEIAARLREHPSVLEAYVSAIADEADQPYLCAYYTLEFECSYRELQSYLRNNVPDYMVPARMVELDKFPLTSNGKVDRKRLPVPDVLQGQEELYQAASNDTERTITAIWGKMFNINKVGVNNNFFELGGNSLKAVVLSSHLFKEFGTEVSIQAIFQRPTVCEQAAYINSLETGTFEPIRPAALDPNGLYPATSSQKRLYAVHQLEGNLLSYNMPVALSWNGSLDPDTLNRAFLLLINRHESLRTSFEWQDDELMQRVHDNVSWNLPVWDADGKDWRELVAAFVQPFDLEQAPLLRAGVIRLHSERHVLLLDMHHSISDGVSLQIFVQELVQLYYGKPLSDLPIQFKDFAIWQEQRQDGEAMKLAESYWLESFQGDIPLLELPTDHPRPVVKRHRGERIRFNLEQAHVDRLRSIGLKQGTTLNMILLAAYSLFIAKYTGQEDIVIGTPWEGRDYPGLNGTLGMFVQTLPIRTYPRSAMTFNEFLEEIRSQVLEAAEHRAFSLDQLIEKLKLQRDTGRNPLFDTMFALQSVNMEKLETCGEGIEWLNLETGIAKFDLLLTANEHDDGIAFELEFDTDLFYRATAERMSAHLLQLFQDIAVKSDCRLSEITMLGDVEKERLLTDFQPEGGQYPAQQTLQELFEMQAALLPDSIAVQHGSSRITYAELNARANRLARAIQAWGLQRQAVVGLMLDRSIDMVVAILGVLKAGGVYLPIDPEYPVERIEYMLADSGSQWLLMERRQSVPANFAGQCFYLDEEELAHGDAANLPVSSTADDLAYIIYTSGSTGRAKGNMATHANISRVVCETNYIELTSDDKILQLSNYAFDGSTFDIYGALLNGAELVLIDRDDLLNLQNLTAIIQRQEISVFFVTTALFNTLADHALDCFVRVRKILFGGERVSVPHVKKVLEWIGPGKLIHVYGPTESTVFATYYPVDSVSDDVTTIPIGRPIAQTEAYIMDADLNLLPVGVKGQLCLSGEGLVKGYLNNPELTAQKFVNHPYKPGSKLYLTGDTAKWLPDGYLEYIGRMDHQVKIRGYRIEPGEITKRLLQHEDVKEAIVLSRADDRCELYLCAYYATRQPIRQVDLQAFLRATLPSYMIPAVMMELERFPLTANGKIDQRALPIPERGNSDEYAAPSTVTELRLAGIIQDILSIERIGLHDNFFEAGGQSLKAMVLASRVQQAFQVSLSLKHIFKHPTLQEMAAYIDAAAETEYHSIPKADKALDYPVSSAQKRMYIIHQMDPDSILYNMPVVYEVKGSIDASRLQEAFHQLSMRHESLRTSFRMSGQEIVQQIDSCASFQLELVDAVDEEDSSLRARIAKWVRPFDLGQAPLARGFVIRIAQDRNLLVLDMHHIISDGLSFNLYVNDLQKLYRGETLPEQRLQYKDYAVWQHNRIGSKEQRREQTFWLETLAGELPVLELQEDLPRPQIQRFRGSRIRTTLSSRQTDQLTMLANRQGLTPFIALFAMYNILLHKYSGQEDIIIGTPVAGRAHPDLENVSGMFVNTLPLRNYPVPDKTFTQFVDEVMARVLDAFAHQHYPLEELIDKLGVHRDLSRNPLFSTMFVWQNMDRIAAALEDAALTPYSINNQTAKFDLTLGITEQDGELGLEWEYNIDIFVQDTITRLARNFEHLVDAVLQDPEQRIAEVEWVCDEQCSQIIETFNGNKGDFPTDQTIQQFMEQSAALDPHRIVLVEGELSYTCGALNERANRLAHLIRSNGVGPNDIVAIMTSRSAEMVVSILAVLKAGGAYLPIDPISPVERTAFMLQDSCASLMLVQEAYRSMILDHGKPVIVLDPESDYSDQAGNPVAINSSEDLAYIIYTSGSTGKPKGVMVKHRSVVNTMLALEADYPLRSGDSYMFKTTYTFDVSVAELFGWIFGQGRLVVLPDGDEKDPGAILNAIQKYCITHINFVPSMLQLFLRNASQVKILNMLTYVFAAGEALPKELVEKLYAQSDHVMLVNLYGPTESTIYATQYTVERNLQGRVPIGKQLRNVTACIMNKYNQLVPIGVPGELCLAGEGLAVGYLNNTELTDEKFTPHPFMRGERLYRTGDMAVWRTDGMIEYLGRIDHQVKVRGYRIELEEIQSRLMEAEGISDAIVMAYLDEHEESYLCGYVVASREWTQSELRMHLITRLPAYMIPSYFVQMDKMPLTPSGKVNRKALPPANRAHVRNDGSQAEFATETEKRLAMLWSEILSVEVAGAYDDFFELGGHSLKAALLTARISETMGLSLPLRVIFEKPKLEQLAEWIDESERQVQERIVPAPLSELYPATYSQTRLFVLNQFNPLNMSYNMPCIMLVKDVLDQERIYKAYAALINRHEILRTSFEMDGARLVQWIHADIEPDYRFVIAANGSEPESHIRSFIRPFEFNRDSYVRLEVIRLSQAEHLLMIDMHHMISDGISLNVFVKELFDLYEERELPPAALQFKDYAVWQQRRLDGDDYALQESYWTALFQDEAPVLQLPTDYARSAVQQFDGGRLFVKLDESLSHAVNRLAIAENATLFMLLLSVYYTLLHKYSGQEDVVVGVPVSSRPDSELQQAIGMFVNTLAIRAMPEDHKTFRTLLAEVKEAFIQAHEYRDYPLEKLIEHLSLQRDMGRSPLFDTMFTIQNAESDVRTTSTITCEPLAFHHEYSKFDLTVGVMDKDGRLTMEWEYSTALFKRSTVERMAGHFVRLLEQIVHRPELRLSEADIVTEQEREQLLRTFNDTSVNHPTQSMVHEHFEQQAERVPNRPAVVWREEMWTYRELNERSNRIAHALRRRGAAPDAIVGILMERSPDMIAGMLGILKSGAAYMPIDPEYPAERIAHMLRDSGTKLVLTHRGL
ncbi:non-ribosomal peptide synthetase, partial [Paenibacillus algorifonticola]